VNQIMFSRGVEAVFRERDPLQGMRELHRRLVASLGDLTALVRSDLSPLERSVVVTLVTADVHGRDIGKGEVMYSNRCHLFQPLSPSA
jgi:hypothetical protein